MNAIGAVSDLRRLAGHSLLVFTGRVIQSVLGFGVSVLVARLLGPENFGLFSLFLVVMIIGHVVADALDPGVVRYYAYYARHSPSETSQVLGSALVLRLLIGIPLALVGWTEAGWIARTLFQDATYELPVRLGLIGSLGAVLWSFNLAVFQAREHFSTYAILTPLVNMLRVVFVPVLLGIGQFTLAALLALHVAFFYVGTLVGFAVLRRDLTGLAVSRRLVRDLVRFGKWSGLAGLCFLIQSHFGVPALSYFSGAGAAGIYSAGMSLLLVVDYLTVTILTVQLPAVSALTGLAAYRAYVRRSLPLYAGMAVALSPAIFLARPLILVVYGTEYEAAVRVFQVLFVGFLATLVTHPLYLVFYAMDRPSLYAATAGASLAGWLTAAILLIPRGGALGAALAMVAGRMMQAILIACLLWGTLGRERRRPAGGRPNGIDPR